MNLILHTFFNWMVRAVGKPKNITAQYQCRAITIFIAQFFNTVIIYMLVFHSIFVLKTRLETSIYGMFIVGPFAEVDPRWYLTVGSPIVFTLILQIATPHLGMLLRAFFAGIWRCFDRSWTSNDHKTKQPSQADYEELYTGPEFILQIRLAQLLSVIYISLTFSSGLPIIYLICTVYFFITYWVDKIVLLRYCRLTPHYSKYVTGAMIKLMPYAALSHFLFGFVIMSNPNILRSEINEQLFGESNTITLSSMHFNYRRQGQHHMLIYFFSFIAAIAIIFFEDFFVFVVSSVS